MKLLKLVALLAVLDAVALVEVHAAAPAPAQPQAPAPVAAATVQPQQAWDFAAFKKAMEESGRKVAISEQTFKNILARKTTAEKTVQNYPGRQVRQGRPGPAQGLCRGAPGILHV